jgi:hypothetical protein
MHQGCNYVAKANSFQKTSRALQMPDASMFYTVPRPLTSTLDCGLHQCSERAARL